MFAKKKKQIQKKLVFKNSNKLKSSSTGSPSPRPYGPGHIPEGPTGFSHNSMMYSPGGGTDFYRINQTGKEDLIVVNLLKKKIQPYLIFVFFFKQKYEQNQYARMFF